MTLGGTLQDETPLVHAPTDPGTSRGYVRELDGLRAVAVLLVVLFHLGLRVFRSGFLGVDIFFVISGFLITTLLLAERQRTGRISLPTFWSRRARRLLPALLLMLLVLAGVERFFATLSERVAFRGDLVSTAAYVANWHFIGSAAYFANTGISSPLEHTWSLAIEEQFYLVWPLLVAGLLLLWKRPAVGAVAALGIAVSASFLASRWVPDAVDRAYMGTDARIFEPMVGALGAVIVLDPRVRSGLARHGAAMGVIGVLGVLAAVIFIRPTGDTYYFGGAVFLSTMTMLVIFAVWMGQNRPLRALGWSPLVWVGSISYGVYLWHWPITLWLGARDPGVDHLPLRRALAFVLTIGTAAASYYLVERPIRRAGRRNASSGSQGVWRPRNVLIAVPAVLSIVTCASIAATRVPPPAADAVSVLVTGDSVPKRLMPYLERATQDEGWRFADAATGGCPVTGEEPFHPNGIRWTTLAGCARWVVQRESEALAAAHPTIVLWWDRPSISSFWASDGELVTSGSDLFWRLRRRSLAAAVQRLSADGALVVFVATEPVSPMIDTSWPWARFMADHYFDTTSMWNGIMRRYAARHPQLAAFVSITDAVCHRPLTSPCNDEVDGVSARPDGLHYDGPGIALAVDALLRRLAPLVAPLGASVPSGAAGG